MTTERRATSADVAQRAGVSRATVSYVLNDAPNQSITASTRQRVLAAAEELGYVPHAVARALRAGGSRLVLFVNAGVPYGSNLSRMVDALAAEVAASGRSLVLWQQRDPDDFAATITHLQPALTITLGRLDAEQRALLARAYVPHVETDAGSGPGAVDPGVVLQVRHLAARGHRQLGYLTTTDPRLARFAGPRLAGARETSAELDLPPPLVARPPEPLEASVGWLAGVLADWTRRPDRVSAVACYNDVCAAACLAAADRAGIVVPDALAVVGMDDEPMSAFTRPPLTTVRLLVADFARDLWAQAVAALNGAPTPASVPSMHHRLVERQSA